MDSKKLEKLLVEIQILKAKLIKSYNDSAVSYQYVLKISQELDILILEYHRLLTIINKRNHNRENSLPT